MIETQRGKIRKISETIFHRQASHQRTIQMTAKGRCTGMQ